MRYLWLVLAFVVALVSVLVGRSLRLSREATATAAIVPMWLAMFPFMKQYAPKLKFSVWALIAVVSAAVAGVLFYVFR
ncbi:MAG: hypothetical protein QOH71_3180 [Blastocatellia bacterium]|jgi:hypothetical protein|nr:hypothetical protein [Blastocatellia bacterium]